MSEKFIQICFIHLCGAPEENYTHSGLHRLLDEIPGVKYLGGDHSAVLPCKHFKDENTQSPPVQRLVHDLYFESLLEPNTQEYHIESMSWKERENKIVMDIKRGKYYRVSNS